MIVTMDGPAGAGKSSIARILATRLGFDFLDTGAMYRCVTLRCLQQRIDLTDDTAMSELARQIVIEFEPERIRMNGQDVTDLIRTSEVTQAIRPIADNPNVRRHLTELQREWAGSRDVVTEGRDQGTVAFPNAECKIFLTASPEERARRRMAQLTALGVEANYDQILAQQTQRDHEDTHRLMGGLKAAPDSIYVHTDGLAEDEVVDRLVELVKTYQSRLESTT